ncbi:venom allergen 3-like isoform X2 [Periplaneta americana]|uniref:venom allergen 3-like isoform X2 n=1 Tax=Periplaneta americana TaxID=6978 RepID=UPI0037E8814B
MDTYAAYIILLCYLSRWAHCFDYCQLTCLSNGQETPHTMCEYKETPGPHCTGYKREALTQEEKNILLKKHNDLRRTVALGRETRGSPGPQPPASDMSELMWDDELAKIAQRWSDQCTEGHDKCRRVERFAVGQNYASSSTTAPTFLKELEVHVQRWYDEVKDVAPDTVNKFPGSSTGIIGHYTQLVWAQTKYVGCGRTFYEDNGKRTTTLLCNYGPAGNFLGSKLYRKGKPCSACKEGATCNDGLCSYGGARCNARPELFLSILMSSVLIFVTHYVDLD